MKRMLRSIQIPYNRITAMRQGHDTTETFDVLLERDSKIVGFHAETGQIVVCFDPDKLREEVHTFYLVTMDCTLDLYVDDCLCGIMLAGSRLIGVFHRPTKTRIVRDD